MILSTLVVLSQLVLLILAFSYLFRFMFADRYKE